MRRRTLMWVLLGLGLIVALFVTLPVFSTLQPDYYRRYPTMNLRMDNWETSTHSKISCAECHVEPGVRGMLSFAADSIPAFYSQLLEGPAGTNLLQAPSRDACHQCHTRYRAVAPSGDLLIPHRAHVEVLGMQCVTCHRDLVHSQNRYGFNKPEMETCLTCHDGDKASNACTDCHTRKNTPDSHKGANWLAIHGSQAEVVDCGQCHNWTPSYCAKCHEQRPASHAGNWKTDHAPHARTRKDGCLVCHGQQFCDKCH
ncbi:MAG: cytochrome c family protein [Actinobacteria bacterium]|nr:cytochrome c family protein [Actinomycetota bacterium]